MLAIVFAVVAGVLFLALIGVGVSHTMSKIGDGIAAIFAILLSLGILAFFTASCVLAVR